MSLFLRFRQQLRYKPFKTELRPANRFQPCKIPSLSGDRKLNLKAMPESAPVFPGTKKKKTSLTIK